MVQTKTVSEKGDGGRPGLGRQKRQK